jgi:tetratricopeptide (TPR) repeat protein
MVCSSAVAVFSCGLYSVGTRIYGEMLERGSARDVERALALLPDNPAYWIRNADLLDREGGSPTAPLEAAAARAPYDAGIWIRLGLDAEARGNFASAESSLLRAARVSRLYQPRWTLANYYFRRGAPADFWKWTRLALEVAPEDPTALFQLCWNMSTDPEEIFRKAIPGDRRIRRAYGSFLLAQKRDEAARAVIGRLLADARPEDRDLLLEACDRSLAEGNAEFAVADWNALCERNLLACAAIHAGAVTPLSEITLDPRTFGRGFAWRAGTLDGVEFGVQSGVMTLDFSGREPESAELLWRWVPAVPGRKSVVRFEYQTAGVPVVSGLAVQVLAGGNERPLAASGWLSSSAWKQESLPFKAPAENRAVRLRLAYSRQPGEVRIEGSLRVRAIRLESAP